jgi:nitrite reductase/ring-hydroxylating ferredoxin subunit
MMEWLKEPSWEPVGLLSGLQPQTAERANCLGIDLAIWRGQDGAVHAWENRCPHRGMRLSYGFVRGNTLTCLYHGWRYDGSGACVAIPAHPALTPPKTIKVQKLACEIRHGLIWVAPESISVPPPAVEGSWIDCRSIAINAAADVVRDVLTKKSFPCFAMQKLSATSNEDATHSAQKLSPSLVRLRSATGDDVLCAIQAASPTQTFVHVQFSVPSAEGDSAKGRLHFACWTKRLRGCIEDGAFAGARSQPMQEAA